MNRPKPQLIAGQQALATFMAGVVLSLLSGVAPNVLGRNFVTYALVNLSGCAILLGMAHVAAWFKAGKRQQTVRMTSAHAALGVARLLPNQHQ